MVPGERIATRNSHGTGCSLSSAMATVQARVGDWEAALREVKPWLQGALRESGSLDVGSGNGPVHHFHHLHRPGPAQPAGRGPGPGGRRVRPALWEGAAADLEAIYGLDVHPGPGRGHPAGTGLRLLPCAGRPLPQRLLPGAGPGAGHRAHRGRAAVLGPSRAEVPRSRVGAAPDLAGHPPRRRRSLGPVTKSYVDHLLAASVSRQLRGAGGRGPALLLALRRGRGHAARGVPRPPERRREHPYAAWLRTYADEEFAAATRQAIAFTDAAARRASAGERTAMALAFRQSSRYEVDFFDAPRLHA